MPYARPTLTTLINQALQDVSSSPIGLDGFLSRSIMRVMAVVQAGFAYLHYDYQDWIARQAVPWTAEDEYLDGWGALKGVNREPPSAAGFTATFSGTSGTIPVANTATASNGYTFLSTAAATVSGSSVTDTFVATAVGSASSVTVGSAVTLGGGIAGINAASGIVTTATPGTDIETDANYRTRVLQAYADPPQGGSVADYVEWALAVPGVTRAWVIPQGNGAGTVAVYPMFDTVEAVVNWGFPVGANGVSTYETRDTAATGDLLTVANYIFPLRPVTALVYADCPINTPKNFTITGLGAANTTANQIAITAALAQMFMQYANVGGSINPATGATYPAIDPSAWYEAIASVVGNVAFTVSSPSGPITPTTGQLFTVGTVTLSS